MNYSDVGFLVMDIQNRFAGKQLACTIVVGKLTTTELVFEVNVFGQEDLREMATVAAGHNVVIVDWAVIKATSFYPTLQVTLYISEVQKNGQPEND